MRNWCGIISSLCRRKRAPILNISKILSATQKRYSQIQKEALSLVYALKKFHQFLYGRKFIVVTDHKPLVTLFAPDKDNPAMALENSLSTENGCVFYRVRVIIPSGLRNHILELLHLGHFDMQRMKQLARSTVY